MDKYTWRDLGSSYALNDMNAAFLWAQLQEAREITHDDWRSGTRITPRFAELENEQRLRRPVVPPDCRHNAHMYYVLLPARVRRERFIAFLEEREINAVFHYVPLHSSDGGSRYARRHGDLAVTEELSERLVRLPLWAGMTDQHVERVVAAVHAALEP